MYSLPTLLADSRLDLSGDGWFLDVGLEGLELRLSVSRASGFEACFRLEG